MKTKKGKKALLGITAFALCLSFCCAAFLSCGKTPYFSSEDGTTNANEPMRESGRGELLEGGIGTYLGYGFIEIAWCYYPPQIVTGNYASYRYYGVLSPSEVKEEYIGERLEQAEVYLQEEERHVNWDIFEIRGVEPTIAVCLYFKTEKCYSVYLNRDHAFETFADFTDAWNLEAYLTLRSSISCYEYCTKDSTYFRRYEANAEAAATLQKMLLSIDGAETTWNDDYGDYKRAVKLSYAYLEGLDRGSIFLRDNGFLEIVFSECQEIYYFDIGKEAAEQILDHVEGFPRAVLTETTNPYDHGTITETTTTILNK